MHDAIVGRQGRRRWGRAWGRICSSPARADILYELVEQYYPAFVAHLAARERTLPVHVQREFEATLKCARLGG